MTRKNLDNDDHERPANAFTTRDHARAWIGRGRPISRASARFQCLGSAERQSDRANQIAPTCEVGGDPVWTTVSRPVVTTDTTVASL